MKINRIACIHTDFPTKFGIPRQSGLVKELAGTIIFEPKYQKSRRIPGIGGIFSYLAYLGVFRISQGYLVAYGASAKTGRQYEKRRVCHAFPFRPNPIGLSCVCLEEIEIHPEYGPVLHVTGADLMDKTPILDIKPYIPHADSHPEAEGGFASRHKEDRLEVEFPEELEEKVPESKRTALKGVLANDPRPAYQNDPKRVYGFGFAGLEVRFTVRDGCLTVCEVVPEI